MGAIVGFIVVVFLGIYLACKKISHKITDEKWEDRARNENWKRSELRAEWFNRYVDDELEAKYLKGIRAKDPELVEKVKTVMESWDCPWCTLKRMDEAAEAAKNYNATRLRFAYMRRDYNNKYYETDAVRILLAQNGKIRRDDATGISRDVEYDRCRSLYEVVKWMSDELQKHGMNYPIIVAEWRNNEYDLRYAEIQAYNGKYTWVPIMIVDDYTRSVLGIDLDKGTYGVNELDEYHSRPGTIDLFANVPGCNITPSNPSRWTNSNK